jgi:pilus assembly protein CpaF
VRLVDGTRIAAVFPPASPTGVCASIRKAALPDQSLSELGPAGTMTKEAQTVLEAALAGQRNVLVTGDTGAVAALLGAIAAAVPADKRVVSIGAALPRAKAGWTEFPPAGDMPGLIRVAAALRADYFLLGETGGPEVLDVLLAAARGQEGVIFGLSGRSASEALARIEALALQNPGVTAVPQLANSTLDLVVHVVALAEGGSRVVEISEVKLDTNNRLTTDPVLVWRSEGSRRSGASGKMQIIGVTSRLAAAIATSGGSLPSNLIRK